MAFTGKLRSDKRALAPAVAAFPACHIALVLVVRRRTLPSKDIRCKRQLKQLSSLELDGWGKRFWCRPAALFLSAAAILLETLQAGIRLINLLLLEVRHQACLRLLSCQLHPVYNPLHLLAYAGHPAAAPSQSSLACPVSRGRG